MFVFVVWPDFRQALRGQSMRLCPLNDVPALCIICFAMIDDCRNPPQSSSIISMTMNWWNGQLLLLLLASSHSEPVAAAVLRGRREGTPGQGSSAKEGFDVGGFEGEANDGEDQHVPEPTIFDGFPDGLLSSLPRDNRNAINSAGNEVIDQYHRNERNVKQTRIIGGRDATQAEHSYTVAILDRWGRQYCGGSLISIDTVLTAAHCTHRVTDKGPLKVVVGRMTLSDEDEGQVITVRREMIHPRYDIEDVANFQWDFSVLLLSTPVFGPEASIIKLNSDKQWPVGGAAEVTGECGKCAVALLATMLLLTMLSGWGDTNSEITVRQPSDTLQVARLKIIPNEECNAVSGRWYVIILYIHHSMKDATHTPSGGITKSPTLVTSKRP